MDEAVKTCIEQNAMREFLLKHRGEVCNVILTEYDPELHLRSEKKLSYEEGVKKGRENMRTELATNLLDILDDSAIAARTGLSVEQVAMIRAGK